MARAEQNAHAPRLRSAGADATPCAQADTVERPRTARHAACLRPKRKRRAALRRWGGGLPCPRQRRLAGAGAGVAYPCTTARPVARRAARAVACWGDTDCFWLEKLGFNQKKARISGPNCSSGTGEELKRKSVGLPTVQP
jgi:hypothetical protein